MRSSCIFKCWIVNIIVVSGKGGGWVFGVFGMGEEVRSFFCIVIESSGVNIGLGLILWEGLFLFVLGLVREEIR